MRSIWMATVLALAACGGEDAVEPPAFAPEMEFEFTIVAGPDLDLNEEFDSTERTSLHAAEGETFQGRRYRVPDYLCLRANGTPWGDLPGDASGPGESATIEVLLPLEGTDSGMLVFLPHGDGFEFIEAIALEVYKAFPDVAETFGVHPDHGTRGVEQSTQLGGKRNIVSTSASRNAITMARLGATVLMPGNCWGDGGHGTGDDGDGDGYYGGRRWGGSFDDAAWAWARAEFEHEPAREVAVGCSGGGHRIAEALVRDPAAFQAVILDSPADDVSAFIEDPVPELLGQATSLLRDQVPVLMDAFFDGTFGGIENASRASLGHALPEGAITAPIFLTYSTGDPAVTEPVTRAVAAAVADRGAPNMVIQLDVEVHCQLNTDEAMAVATDWLAGVLD